jgi:small subunit ribosomal protein S5
MKIRLQRETAAEKEKRADQRNREREARVEAWKPKTKLGKMVKDGKIQSYDEVIKQNLSVLEPEIVDMLIPELKEQVMEVRKTTKVTRSGRNFRFRVGVIVGNGQGLIGVGNAKDRERWPAAKKAVKNAKLNLVSIRRGCGSWECQCGLGHTVPFTVEGKSASVRVKLMPAPKGTGLVVGDSIKPVLKFVGIEDVWSSSQGNTGTKLNFVKAAIDALTKTTKMKLSKDIERKIKVKRTE